MADKARADSPTEGDTASPENSPAFPASAGHDVWVQHNGMSLRDYFAGKALAWFAGSPYANSTWRDSRVASACYEVADAMLTERAKVRS